MSIYPKILKVRIINELLIHIDFDNGESRYYNFKDFVKKHCLTELENPDFLKAFTIAPGGYGLVWNDDIDIAESELWINGKSDFLELTSK